MTLPTSDPLSSRSMPSTSSASTGPVAPARPPISSVPHRPQPQIIPSTHSIPENPVFPHSPHIVSPSLVNAAHGDVQKMDHEHAIDFATHSWDLATGGLKTLTAKRELPIRPDRRASNVVPDMLATSRSYMFFLVILASIVLMLIGGGIVLFVMLQP